MEMVLDLFVKTLIQVGTSFLHNWPYLLLSVVISVLLKLYVDSEKVSAFLLRYRKAGVIGATAAAVGTPLCSCGTTAIILGMMASMMPWAPIVAFMVASPLTSPEGLIYSAGLFGWPFALVYFASSIVLGLLGGAAASILESRGWLANQVRFSAPEPVRQSTLGQHVAQGQHVASQHVTQGQHVASQRATQTTVMRLPLTPALSTCGCGASEPAIEPAFQVAQFAGSGLGSGDTHGSGAAHGTSQQTADPAPIRPVLAPSCCGSAPRPVETPACGCGGAAETVSQPAQKEAAPHEVAAAQEVAAPQEVAGTCSCGSAPAQPAALQAMPLPATASACGCGSAAPVDPAGKKPPVTLRQFWYELYNTGGRLLLMFTGFAFIGYFLNGLIPSAWVAALFGSGNIYSVPLAASLGVPLYINSEGSLPLVRALIDGGMSQGAAMAFLITGSGTSVGAVAGMLTIARWRVIGLVVGTLWVGAVAFGYLFDLGLALHLF